MESMVGKHVEIVADVDLPEYNRFGRIVEQDDNVVYVSNMSMPYQGTFDRRPFTINEVRIKT